MIHALKSWRPAELWAHRRRICRCATSVLLAVALQAPPAAVSAEQPSTAPSFATEFKLRFVPAEEREEVPYELGRGVVLFEAEVNGRKVGALLDNGFTTSVLDLDFAHSLGLQLIPLEERGATPDGEIERWRGPEVDMSIPGQIRMRTPSSATDLSAVSTLVGRPISLVVGKEYFQVLAVMVSPSDRHFQFARSGSLGLPADTRYLELLNTQPQVQATIAGRRVVLTIDLGYNGDIALSPQAWDRLGFGDQPSVPNLSVTAAGRISGGAARHVDEVLVGSTSFTDVTVTSRPLLPEHGDGLIGFAILSRYNFAIDINARRLWLVSRVQPTSE